MEVLIKTDIKVLRLSNNEITSLPSEIGQLVNIEELYVDHNKLTGSLPGEIRKMENLLILDASHNNMTGVPAEIGQLKKLRRLDLSSNSLTALPNEIYDLRDNLKNLDLYGNSFDIDYIVDLQGKMYNTKINF